MAKSSSILSSDTDKAHFVAQGVLCALGTGCVLAVIWAVGHGSGSVLETPAEKPSALLSALNTLPKAPQTLPAPAPAVPKSRPGVPASVSAPAPSPAPSPSVPKRLDALNPIVPVVPADRQLKNPQVIEAVEAARAVRRLGDMATALESLRAADLREPNHPEIMGEMALTYEAMGLPDKAVTAWRGVLAMGEAAAGGYYTLAKSKLDSSAEMTAPITPPSDQGGVTLGRCEVIRDPKVTKGERITVRVPIVASPGTVVDPSKMDIHVFLFEEINNGERIEQVRAETPQQNWVSAPVDWKEGGSEAIDVTYDLPPPKPGEVRDLGKRSFHGFIVKLFYQNRLAGEQAQPQSLLNYTQQPASPAGVDNSLFPK